MQPTERQLAAGRALGEAIVRFLLDVQVDLQPKPDPATPRVEAQSRKSDQGLEPLLVGSREACRLLGISGRTLWGLTSPRGPIKATYLGNRAVRYSIEDLKAAAGALKTRQKRRKKESQE